MVKDDRLYRLLEVDESASDSEIAAAYGRLCVQYPETDPHRAQIDYAFSVLSDISKRAEYDITGKTGKKTRRARGGSNRNLDKARSILNTVFLLGAAVTAVLFLLQFSGYSTTPFYWACGISLVIKLTEYILRLIP
ncbi:MAG: DnaJ domain-containing protein [Bacteroidaceae bacterium]|nr:DnaJ domain-containing protein [Bacteroidaceae bacterium]